MVLFLVNFEMITGIASTATSYSWIRTPGEVFSRNIEDYSYANIRGNIIIVH
jgi:hypothetical protein